MEKCKDIGDKDLFKKNILLSINNGNLNDLIANNVSNGSYLMVNNENDFYLISTLENQMFMGNLTSINFSECEGILRDESEKDKQFYTFRIDYFH